ncbi:MAG TPA: methyltransferase domain-containing protein [Pyrinomonadaceae bacterium]|nr:methyltransferase domain-containing protein [Pyrinomonadaceae bacterium]
MISEKLRASIKRVVPASVYKPIMSRWRRRPIVRWGNVRRLQPFSAEMGLDRGHGIDRYYIESFLQEHSADIKGTVLEIADNNYTVQFGGNKVERSEVLHAVAGNPRATIVGNLETGENIPTNAFDCIICTQTFPFLYDFKGAIRSCHRALKPGGVLLATFAGITQVSRYDMDRWGDYWRFTTLSTKRIFAEIFELPDVTVSARGNVLTSVSSLLGLAAEDLKKSELDYVDRDYEQLITVRAVKSA